MTSKVSIISEAFTLLGKGILNDLTSTIQAQAASNLYDRVYPLLLTRFPWHFALRMGIELNLIDDVTNVEEWKYAYQMPVDLLALYRMRPNIDYIIATDKIYTNYQNLSSPLRIDYTVQVEEKFLSPSFISALVYRMAAECAMPVTQDKNLMALWMAQAQSSLNYAMFLDSKSNPSVLIQSNPLWQAHYT